MARASLEEIQKLFEEVGENAVGKTSEELKQGARERASATVEERFDITIGINLSAFTVGEQAEINKGLQEAKAAAKDLKSISDTETIDKYQTAKSWGKWVGTQVAQGLLFSVGAQSITSLYQEVYKKDPADSNQSLQNMAQVSEDVIRRITAVVNNWHKWFNNHYGTRVIYGTVDIEDTSVLRFEILQVKLSNINSYRSGQLVKDAVAAKQALTTNSLIALLKSEQVYTDMCSLLAADITLKEILMRADGLQDHVGEINAIQTELNNAIGAQR